MLDQLPNELLQNILLYIGPPFWDEWDDDRHPDLCSLSLVSKRLRTFAQPLLFSVLTLQVWSTARLLQEYESTSRCRDLVSNVRFIRCGSPRYPETEKELDFESARAVARTLVTEATKLCEVLSISSRSCPATLFNGTCKSCIYFFFARPITDKDFAVALKRLHLSSTSELELQDLLLPQLTHFSLGGYRVEFRGIEKEQLPSLRHLAWWGHEALDDTIVATIQNFDGQLDSLGFPLALLPLFRQQLPDFPLTRVLLDVYPGSDDNLGIQGYIPSQVEVVNLRIDSYIFCSDWVDEERLTAEPEMMDPEMKDLQQLITIIRDTPSSPLRSVYIRANRECETRQVTEEARQAKADLVRICHSRVITLVQETQPETGWDSRISEDFTRRMSLVR